MLYTAPARELNIVVQKLTWGRTGNSLMHRKVTP